MYKWEVHYYLQGVSGQLVQVITASNRFDAEKAIKAVTEHPGGKGRSPSNALAARACSEPSSASNILNRSFLFFAIMGCLLSP